MFRVTCQTARKVSTESCNETERELNSRSASQPDRLTYRQTKNCRTEEHPKHFCHMCFQWWTTYIRYHLLSGKKNRASGASTYCMLVGVLAVVLLLVKWSSHANAQGCLRQKSQTEDTNLLFCFEAISRNSDCQTLHPPPPPPTHTHLSSFSDTHTHTHTSCLMIRQTLRMTRPGTRSSDVCRALYSSAGLSESPVTGRTGAGWSKQTSYGMSWECQKRQPNFPA